MSFHMKMYKTEVLPIHKRKKPFEISVGTINVYSYSFFRDKCSIPFPRRAFYFSTVYFYWFKLTIAVHITNALQGNVLFVSFERIRFLGAHSSLTESSRKRKFLRNSFCKNSFCATNTRIYLWHKFKRDLHKNNKVPVSP